MPVRVRNFWLEAVVDGRSTRLAGGPTGRAGGLQANIYIRDEGNVSCGLALYCQAHADGTLTIQASPCDEISVRPVWDETTQTLTVTTHRDKETS